MRLLLDAHAFLWAVADSDRLSEASVRAIEDRANDVAVSAATVWEIEIKRAAGKLKAPRDVLGVIDRSGFDTLAVTAAHGVAAARLPQLHRDPFDRMLVAQARAESFTIVTRDAAIADYDVPVLAA